MVMRLTVVVIFVFGFLAWGMSRNHGYYTRHLNAYLDDIGRLVRRGV